MGASAMAISRHPCNIIWALPSHLLVTFMILMKKKPKYFKRYYIKAAIYYILFFVVSFFIPFEFDSAIYPITFMLLVRFVGGYLHEKNLKLEK